MGALSNRTAIVIAHRLSTIRHADQIIVLRNGEIVERGTHDELVAAAGEYYDMWSHQLRDKDTQKAGVVDDADAAVVVEESKAGL
jgi:ABC-type multidrug transport system fused ATPase/permease subunit